MAKKIPENHPKKFMIFPFYENKNKNRQVAKFSHNFF